jgi:hypothetical protein
MKKAVIDRPVDAEYVFHQIISSLVKDGDIMTCDLGYCKIDFLPDGYRLLRRNEMGQLELQLHTPDFLNIVGSVLLQWW